MALVRVSNTDGSGKMNGSFPARSLSSSSCIVPTTRLATKYCLRISQPRIVSRAKPGITLYCSVPLQSQPDSVVSGWQERVAKAVGVLVGFTAIFVAYDILHFLGSSPPSDGDAWRRLTSPSENEYGASTRKATEPIVIYDRHKRVIAQFSSNAVPLSQVLYPELCAR
jgi:hypothetical protein